MPVKAIPKVALLRNGMGAFIRPCYKVTLQFCNWGGSSQGVRDFLSQKKHLEKFASENSNTMFEVKQRSGHPQVVFHYNNGVTQNVDVKNEGVLEICKKLWEGLQRSGNPLFKYNHKVMSENESVRGIWSPMHVDKNDRFKI